MGPLVVPIGEPFDLARTVRALGVGSIERDGTWWWSAHMEAGPATIALEQVADAAHARTWGPGAEEMASRVPRLLGIDDGSIGLSGGVARDLLAAARGLRLGSTGEVHESVVRSILGQVVTRTEAKQSIRSIVRAYGELAPGPQSGLRIFPSPAALSRLNPEDLHSHGIERKRAVPVIEASRRSERLSEILTMGSEAAFGRLLAVRGIGPWTAAMVMGEAYGDTDAVPTGDFHLPNTVAWALAREERGDDERMLELLDEYRPHRRRVLVAIKQSGIRAPKFGPRTSVRDHL